MKKHLYSWKCCRVDDKNIGILVSPKTKLISKNVYEQLLNAIVKGKLKGGERIVESELSKISGVSRPPIREALCMLELDGFVELIPHRGAIVAKITQEEVRQNLEIKAMVEGFAAWIGAQRFETKDIMQLELILENIEKEIEKKNLPGILENNFKFHIKIVESVGNNRLLNIYNSLTMFLKRLYRINLTKDYNWTPMQNEHYKILDNIKKRDADLAESATRQHAFYSLQRALDQLNMSEN
jgi:DNA-binding GntR family transcriptional regulator